MTATAAIAAIAVCAAPGSGAEERPSPARAGSNLDLRPGNALWYVEGETYQRTVRNWITDRDRWRRYDDKPIRIDYRPAGGGAWQSIGEGRQHANAESRYARGTARFRIPTTGEIQLRIRAKVGDTWRSLLPGRTSTVTAGPAAYDPKPIRRIDLGENIALGWKRSYLAHGYGYAWEYPSLSVREGLAAGDDIFMAAVEPDSADTANRLVYSRTIIRGEDIYGERVEVLNPLTGNKRWVSYRDDGTRTKYTTDPAISDTGRWISYVSRDRQIVPGAPAGKKVFLARMRDGKSTSRYVGRGYRTGVSGNGRYVAYLHERALRLWDRRSGETTTVAEFAEGRPGAPEVSDNGRYVTYGFRGEITSWDAQSGDSTVVSTGSNPVMTDDGRYIAFSGPDRNAYGFTDVSRWDRTTGEVTIVSVGPDGEPGTDNPTEDVDMSENGRWIVTSFGNYREPPGPDVTLMDGVIFDLNATG